LSTGPVLRLVDFQPVIYQGQQMWLLRDPLQLSSQQLIFPVALAQILPLLDGSRDVDAVHLAFSQQVGEWVPLEVVVETLEQLDAACLLENERSRSALAAEVARYRAAPFRLPNLAGHGYPGTVDELVSLFAGYEAQASPTNGYVWRGRGIVSPHIDYRRGGPVYAAVWQRSRQALAEADMVVILGTDHNGGAGTLTLTTQPYATPFGVLPSDPILVGRLAAAIGREEAFALELNHRQEHSVELSAVWLHYIYHQLGQAPPPVLPVLTGSFHHFVGNGHHPVGDGPLNRFVETLKAETAGRRVVIVASVDLAHVGPNFGDPFVMDAARRQRLRESDSQLMAAIRAGDHARFYDEIAAVGDRHRICGFSAIYLLLRLLDGAKGTTIAYDHCPADEEEHSLVSICGLLLD
jgi:AmmeMemoRadiSam system protein B